MRIKYLRSKKINKCATLCLVLLSLICYLLSCSTGSQVELTTAIGDVSKDIAYQLNYLPMPEIASGEWTIVQTLIHEDRLYVGAVHYVDLERSLETEAKLFIYNLDQEKISTIDLTEALGKSQTLSNMAFVGNKLHILSFQTIPGQSTGIKVTIFEFDRYVSEKDIPLPSNFIPNSQVFDGEGNLYFGEPSKLYMIGVTENSGRFLEDPQFSGYLYQIGEQVCGLKIINQGSNQRYQLSQIGFGSKAFGKAVSLSDEVIESYEDFYPYSLYSFDQGLAFNSRSGAAYIDFQNNSVTSLMDWSRTGLSINEGFSTSLLKLSEQSYIGVMSNPEGRWSETSLFTLKPKSVEESGKVKVITVGGIAISYDEAFMSAVRIYNSQNSDSQIEVIDYGSEVDMGGTSSAQDWKKAITDFNLQVLSGKSPDILFDIPYEYAENYQKKGLLLDLSSLTESGRALAEDNYQANLLSLQKSESGIFHVGSGFRIKGFALPASMIEKINSWDGSDYEHWITQLPNQQKGFSYQGEKSQLLASILEMELSAILNSNDTLAFNSESLKTALRFCQGSAQDGEFDDWQSRVKNKEQSLAYCEIGIPYHYRELSSIWNEDIQSVGYPGSEHKAATASFFDTVAVYAQTDYKEECLAFLDIWLSKEIQSKQQARYISALKPVLEMQIKNAQTKNYSYNGERLLSEETPPLTEVGAASFLTMIDNLDQVDKGFSLVKEIILEEANYYFSGDKDLDTVIRVIDDRVSKSLAERQ